MHNREFCVTVFEINAVIRHGERAASLCFFPFKSGILAVGTAMLPSRYSIFVIEFRTVREYS
jgi:hypothetical protein